jgi:GTP cyclohydrolase II
VNDVPLLHRYSEADLPTRHGRFRIVVYRERATNAEHCAITMGDLRGPDALVRVHSECFTGEVLHSLRCDCRAQLDLALDRISAAGRGAVVYLRQEGRGIGLGEKVRAYALQDEGLDTVDANLELGFAPDERRYGGAAEILRELGVESISLMTNNPAKVAALEAEGITVLRRVPHEVSPTPHNERYLSAKRERLGHLLEPPRRELPSVERPIGNLGSKPSE